MNTKKFLIKVLYPLVKLRRNYYMRKYIKIGKTDPKRVASIMYKSVMGKELDWNNPRDLNAKINWLKFNENLTSWTLCSDKYAVREYIHEKKCGDMLVKLYGKWNDVQSIDWSILPDKFIIKTNHGSGGNFICNHKNNKIIKRINKGLKKWLNTPFSDLFIEPHYSSITPCIIAEELLDSSEQLIKSSSLVDYKVWCFNGEPKFIFVISNRTEKSAEISMFDTDWNYRPDMLLFGDYFVEAKELHPRPVCLEELLEKASILAGNHPQIRVDMYVVNNHIYFGEMTFTSQGGYMNYLSKAGLEEMGSYCMIDINKNNLIK